MGLVLCLLYDIHKGKNTFELFRCIHHTQLHHSLRIIQAYKSPLFTQRRRFYYGQKNGRKCCISWRSFYTKRDHEHDKCDFLRKFPHESLFVLKAAKRAEISKWNKVTYDLAIIYIENMFEYITFLAYLVDEKYWCFQLKNLKITNC
jgi:hypothetical protein